MKLAFLPCLAALFVAPGLTCSGADLKVDAAQSWVKFNASATGHAFDGSLKKFDAKVSGNPATLEPASASLDWDFSDLDTKDGKRDAEMLKWLDHGKTPKGSFKMSKPWTAKDGKTWVQGNLTIHGVSKTIAFPLTTSKNGDHVKIDGEVWLDYQDFSLPIIKSLAVMTVDPKLKVSFHLEGDAK